MLQSAILGEETCDQLQVAPTLQPAAHVTFHVNVNEHISNQEQVIADLVCHICVKLYFTSSV